ncbi:MAG: glycoside hydrolase family 3, partial [Desulfovibrio sp.]|nr:glycoside hydrolase family 3 [Desulfovibrio sp.]
MLHLLLVRAAAIPLLLPCQALCAPDRPSLDRMIGSMIMCGFRGAELARDDPARLLLQEGRLGHVILF